MKQGAATAKVLNAILSNRWNLAGFISGIVIGGIVPIATLFGKGDDDATIMAFTFTFSFLVYTAFVWYSLQVTSKLHKEYSDLMSERDNAVTNFNNYVAQSERYDASFNDLAKNRIRFEDSISEYHGKNISTEDDWEKESVALHAKLREYLKDICDCAVVQIKSRHHIVHDIVEANVKLVAAGHHPHTHNYVLSARSRNTREWRKKADLALKANYTVESNAFFYVLLNPNSGQRRIVENDFASVLKVWKRQFREGAQEPTESALDYYQKVICFPIEGARYLQISDPQNQDVININEDLVVLGLLFIDSPTVNFLESSISDVVEGLSINAYAAIKAYHCAVDLGRKRVYGK